MIDTLTLKSYLPGKLFEHLIPNGVPLPRRKFPTWTINAPKGSTMPRITVMKTPDDTTHLAAEVSVPRLLFGHNAQLPSEAEVLKALTEISSYVRCRTNVSFPIQNARVSRVDFARDWTCDGNVAEIIRRLSRQALSRKTRILYDDHTIYFDSKANCRVNRILIYDKYQEVMKKRPENTSELEVAKKKIRFEISLRSPTAVKRHIQRRCGIGANFAPEVLRQVVSDKCINALWNDLNFPFADHSVPFVYETLRTKFAGNKMAKLIGFMNLFKVYGPNFFHIESLSISSHAYRRANSDLRSVGLSLDSLP
jgi:hypothetical protein